MEFKLRGQRFTGPNGGPQFRFTRRSPAVECETQDEVDARWNGLLRGGVPLHAARGRPLPDPVAACCDEMLKEADPQKSHQVMRVTRAIRAMQSILCMVELDIAAPPAAYAG